MTTSWGNYKNDLELLANIPAQSLYLLHTLEQAASVIGLYMNSDKTKFIHFEQDGTISSLSSEPLKFVDKFIYLDSNISSTESNINICKA